MAQFAASAFEGTEGDNLSTLDANWVKQSGSTGNAEIASGRARASTTTAAHYYYNTAPASADYSASVEVYNPGTVATGSTHGPSVRMAAGANTSYHARINGAGSLQLYKFVGGTATLLGSASKTIPASGTSAVLTISVSGSTIDVTWDGEGSPAISVTDTSIMAAGYPGLRWTSATTPTDTVGWQGDNFSADEDGGGGVSQTIAFTLDDLTFSASQLAGHSQTLGATLDGVSFSAVQSVGGANSQSLAVTLDGVSFAASQTLGHAQSAAVQLDDLTFSATQSAANPVKSQSLAVTLDDLQFYATQEGPAVAQGNGFVLVDFEPRLWWKRKPKALDEQEAAEKIASVARQIERVAVKQVKAGRVVQPVVSKPAKAEILQAIAPELQQMPGFDPVELYRAILERLIQQEQQRQAEQQAQQIAAQEIERIRLMELDEDETMILLMGA